MGRVTTDFLYKYREPDFRSERAGSCRRDELVKIYEEVRSPQGPRYNPRWYRLSAGFVHSGYIQRVEKSHLNSPLKEIPEGGRLGVVTLPYTQSLRRFRRERWAPLYRLYFSSVYWITSLEEGPDGKPWYGLTDDLLHVVYYVPAAHIRPILPEEIAPLSPGVPAGEKRIEVRLEDQVAAAYEGDQLVRQMKVSTGIPTVDPSPGDIPTDTPPGYYHIQVKAPSRHMGDGNLTSDLDAYELPGVPWVSFFHHLGIGFHGTYWHDSFGRRMSHGCINMRNKDARWLYRWSAPSPGFSDWHCKGLGTLVRII